MSYGYVPPEPTLPREKNGIMRNKQLTFLIVVAAIIGAVVAWKVIGRPSGPTAYLAYNASTVAFVQWQPSPSGGIQGTIAYDSITGTAPNETVSVQAVPFTGAISGSQVTMNVNGGFLAGTRTLTATLSSGTLSISNYGSGGAIQTTTLYTSNTDAYNTAVAALHQHVNHANYQAQQAAAAAQQAQANQQAVQTAENDTQGLQQDASLGSGSNFANDLASFATDVQSSNTDLKTTQRDAGQPKGFCNASLMVNGDTQSLDGDLQSIGGDIQSLRADIQTVHSNIAAVLSDVAALQQRGLTVPGNIAAVVTQARANIRSAIQQANGYIDQANANEALGYQIAQGLATASCSGPGNPSPVPHMK